MFSQALLRFSSFQAEVCWTVPSAMRSHLTRMLKRNCMFLDKSNIRCCLQNENNNNKGEIFHLKKQPFLAVIDKDDINEADNNPKSGNVLATQNKEHI